MSKKSKRSYRATLYEEGILVYLSNHLPKAWLSILDNKSGKEIYRLWRLIDRARERKKLDWNTPVDEWEFYSLKEQCKMASKIACRSNTFIRHKMYDELSEKLASVGLSMSSTSDEIMNAPENIQKAYADYFVYNSNTLMKIKALKNFNHKKISKYYKKFPLTNASTVEEILSAPKWERKRFAEELARQNNEISKSMILKPMIKELEKELNQGNSHE